MPRAAGQGAVGAQWMSFLSRRMKALEVDGDGC